MKLSLKKAKKAQPAPKRLPPAPLAYVAIDISGDFLRTSVGDLQAKSAATASG